MSQSSIDSILKESRVFQMIGHAEDALAYPCALTNGP